MQCSCNALVCARRLPLSDQSAAKTGHCTMIPVQISYPTMAALLNRPPLTSPVMQDEDAVSCSHLTAGRGRLRSLRV